MKIEKKPVLKGSVKFLPTSKSLSNRALILNAISGNKCQLLNLSSARDTQLMKNLLQTNDYHIDVMDSGTTMRFIVAYFALTSKSKFVTGTARMKERPIHPLVEALQQLGAKISYEGNNGFPPINISGFEYSGHNNISMRGDVSSQFISALMMTGTVLENGLNINVLGKINSLPYLKMTVELMRQFGVEVKSSEQKFFIPPQKYDSVIYKVEPDWSAISYWFAFVALAESADIFLPNVESVSLQGDRVIVDIMANFGVRAHFEKDGMRLTKSIDLVKEFKYDFSDCPDLAQTILPICSAKNIPATCKGLESLRIKETDRIEALKQELKKIGATLTENHGTWKLIPDFSSKPQPVFDTYHDHRMAMGIAPLATLMDISIKDPAVVQKSYPTFWNDLKEIGFHIEA